MVDRPLALHLLRRHVRRSAKHGPFPRQARCLLVGLHGRVELRESKIQDLGDLLAVLADAKMNIFRLEVPVNNAGGVGLREALGHLTYDANRRARIDKPHTGHAVVERLADKEFHRNERAPIFNPSGIVNVHDVWALDRGGGPRLSENRSITIAEAESSDERTLTASLLPMWTCSAS